MWQGLWRVCFFLLSCHTKMIPRMVNGSQLKIQLEQSVCFYWCRYIIMNRQCVGESEPKSFVRALKKKIRGLYQHGHMIYIHTDSQCTCIIRIPSRYSSTLCVPLTSVDLGRLLGSTHDNCCFLSFNSCHHTASHQSTILRTASMC